MKVKDFLTEIRALKVSEIKQRIDSLSSEIMRIRFSAAVGQANGGSILRLRRDVARCKTILSQCNSN